VISVGKKSFVVISVHRKVEGLPTEAPAIADPGSDYPLPPVRDTLPPSNTTPNVPHPTNADDVHAVVDHATTTTAGLKGYDGNTLDTVITVTSSDLCGTILGYVDKVVRLGDIVSQVLLAFTLPHVFVQRDTYLGPSICQVGMGSIDLSSQGLIRLLFVLIVGTA
jgi:hypothetical protein